MSVELTQERETSTPSPMSLVILTPYFDASAGQWRDPVDRAAASILSADESRRFGALPFQVAAATLWIALAGDVQAELDSLVASKGYAPVFFRCDPVDLLCAQDRAYGLPDLLDNKLGAILWRHGKVSTDLVVQALKQQRSTGSPIGAVLVSANAVTHWDVAEALAKQKGLPVVDLLSSGDNWLGHYEQDLEPIWTSLHEGFWRLHQVVPIGITRNTLYVAMVNPADEDAIRILEGRFQRAVRVFITGYRDVQHVLSQRYRANHLETSLWGLLKHRPDDSAYHQVSKNQLVALAVATCVIIGAVALDAVWTGIIVSVMIQMAYAAYNAFRLWLMYTAAQESAEVTVTNEEVEDVLKEGSLPIYTILVPLYREAKVIGQLISALSKLEYPKDRLDVKLLLEEDDEDTLSAIQQMRLPNYIEIVMVPVCQPRTKPKACNYGLQKARGEYVVIFDAEDLPDPDQLLKALVAFRQSPDNVACVQAKLDYFNPEQNLLTKWFAVEYANWFDLMLPALYATKMPVPLGGTSNHFRTSVLKSVGAWDPFNVTEDADLGIRLHKAGYRAIVMNSATYEEANASVVNWMRQRSRWVKGYIQTWLVHMRHPRRLLKELGWRDFLAFNAIIGATPFTILLNPWLWVLTLSWYILGPNFSRQIFPGFVYYLAVSNLFFGNFALVFVNMVGLAKRRAWSLVIPAAVSPIYWLFMSIAAWKGFWQVIARPWYWEKTMHGLAHSKVESGLVSAPMNASTAPRTVN